uniref:Uncharacterized protein n=1 Tax=Glossina austeni TaxID=7395 RepID=A0A1A9VMH5_GLOAU
MVLVALSTLYSPGAGVENFDIALGRLCKLDAGGVSLPLLPNPVILYLAGPSPNVSVAKRCFCPNVKEGAANFRESKFRLPNKPGSATDAGPGVWVSAAIWPRLTVGVQGRCSKPATIIQSFYVCKYMNK